MENRASLGYAIAQGLPKLATKLGAGMNAAGSVRVAIGVSLIWNALPLRGHSRPSREGSNSGQARYAAESGSKFVASCVRYAVSKGPH
jgi:hypothetical protein